MGCCFLIHMTRMVKSVRVDRLIYFCFVLLFLGGVTNFFGGGYYAPGGVNESPHGEAHHHVVPSLFGHRLFLLALASPHFNGFGSHTLLALATSCFIGFDPCLCKGPAGALLVGVPFPKRHCYMYSMARRRDCIQSRTDQAQVPPVNVWSSWFQPKP